MAGGAAKVVGSLSLLSESSPSELFGMIVAL